MKRQIGLHFIKSAKSTTTRSSHQSALPVGERWLVRYHRKMKRTILLTLTGLLALASGCTTPDLKPFADSTASLHQAVVQSQKIVRTEIAGVTNAPNLSDPAKIIADNKAISEMFDKRKAFTAALVGYSDSLAAVADAGKNGQANAQALGDSVKTLAQTAGPYGDAVGAASDMVAKVYGLAAQAWAVHTLKEATAKVDPAIQAGAEFIRMDMTNVLAILKSANYEANAAVKSPHHEEMNLFIRASNSRGELASELSDALNATNWVERLAAYNREAGELDKALNRMNEWRAPMLQTIAENDQRFASEEEIVQNTIQGFLQLAKIHADLKDSLAENRQPNMRELVSTVLEIKDEIEQLKKH